jgi:hypothetical protein
MLGGLLAGIALLVAGCALNVLGMMISGAVLTQLSPVTAILAARFRKIRQHAARTQDVGTGQDDRAI